MNEQGAARKMKTKKPRRGITSAFGVRASELFTAERELRPP